MDVPGPNSPTPAEAPTSPPPPAAARQSASSWLWSRRMPARPGAWSQRRKVTVAVVAVALATGGGVAIADTTSTPSPGASSSGEETATAVPAPGNLKVERGGPMGMLKFGMGRGGMVHGEFTVPDGENSYKTMLTQNGTVAGVSGNKLTVKSTDGWSKDYTLDTATMVGGNRFWSPESGVDLTQGQEVHVMATVKDGVAHADHVQTVPDKAMLEKRGAELKQRMHDGMERGMGERGGHVFKFRGGPGDFEMPMPVPGMRMGADERMAVPATPEGGATKVDPSVAPGAFFFDGGEVHADQEFESVLGT